MLQSPTAERTRAVVLLTDGQQTDQPATAEASALALRDSGVFLYTIGLGDDVDGEFLSRLAGDDSRYYAAPEPEELLDIYSSLARSIPCAASAYWGRRP
jgi:hypothetical protein